MAAAQSWGGWQGGDGGWSVRCESIDGRDRFCPIDTRAGVQLARQLSRTPCIEGRTWGIDRGGVWVTQGCRGEFVASRGDRFPGGGWHGDGFDRDLLRCESISGRWQQCAVDARRGVELARQLSKAPCIRGRTWGVDRGGIWVSGGCRAEFRLLGGWGGRDDWRGDDGWRGGWAPERVHCESIDSRRRTCHVPIRGDVRLVRQLSRSPCVEGHTWGVHRDGIWVDRGCRAEFEIHLRGGGRWRDGG